MEKITCSLSISLIATFINTICLNLSKNKIFTNFIHNLQGSGQNHLKSYCNLIGYLLNLK